MLHSQKALERCWSWVRHSGKTREAMAEMAGVNMAVITRLKQRKGVSIASLERVEASIPKNFRDPYAKERAEAKKATQYEPA